MTIWQRLLLETPLHPSVLSPLLLFLLAAAFAVPARGQGAPNVLYVAANGRDGWTGRLSKPNAAHTDGPLASLTGARDAVRKAKADGKVGGSIVVKVLPGAYTLSEPFTLTADDAAGQGESITYEAGGKTKPVFSGGRAITGWRRGANGVWTTEIPDVREGKWYFQSLWVNGERRPRARTPNEGYLHAAGKAPAGMDPKSVFVFAGSDIKSWPDLNDVNVIMFHNWEASRHRIQSVDAASHVVQLTGPAPWPLVESTDRYIVENVPEALDAPGEWYLDRHTGILSYIPKPGEDMSRVRVIAPVLTQLVKVAGEPESGRFVEGVTLKNLAFEYCDWTLPEQGYGDPQAAVSIPPAVQVDGARNCKLEGLEVAHVGGYGVGFVHACKTCTLTQSYVHDTGAGGVKIGEPGLPSDEPLQTDHIDVVNNFIHDGGNVYPSGCGVIAFQTSYNRIEHNEISDFYYTGVSCGWSWGYAPSSAHDNLIADNHIHNLGFGVLSDMGGIYTLGVAPGTVLRHNRIHDVESFSYGGWGIYPDEGSTTLTIEDNIVYNCKSANLHQHYGKDNLIRNNIWAFGREYQLMRTRNEEHRSFTFEHNIVYYRQGDLLGSNWQGGPEKHAMDYNDYWNASGAPVMFQGVDLAAWRARGMDAHSVIADPLFVDPDRYDFRLMPDSPALKLGFKPIDPEGFGLTGPKEWTDLPNRVKNRPWVIKPPEPPKPISQSFDDLPIGSSPPGAMVYGEEKGASIRVAEMPDGSSGRCLKFIDAPGMKNGFDPHTFYQPAYQDGIARFSFDLWMEPGADMYVEWRDNGSPYNVGPSVWVHPDGKVVANGKEVLSIPARRWVRFEETCGLGSKGSAHWDLTVTVRGDKPQRFAGLDCSPLFRTLDWLGFSSQAVETRVFYVDNLKLDLRR